MWRPEGWRTPNVYALRNCKPNQCVTAGDVRKTTEDEKRAYEAGADAMLEALRSRGLHVSRDAEFISLREHCTLSNRRNTGTYLFIPDEETDSENG